MSVRSGGITALLAAMLLALAAHSAAATYFGIDSSTFRISVSDFYVAEEYGEIPVCPVTLEGSFHSTLIAKVWDREIGVVTRASIGTCIPESRITWNFLPESFPLRLQYESYWHELPNISEIKVGIVGLGVEVRHPGGFNCVYQTASEGTPPESPFLGWRPFFILGREWIRANEGKIVYIELSAHYVYNTSFGCPNSQGIGMWGEESITPQGSRSAIHVSLAF